MADPVQLVVMEAAAPVTVLVQECTPVSVVTPGQGMIAIMVEDVTPPVSITPPAAEPVVVVVSAGSPGRDGVDGSPGRDGIDGVDGSPGTDGINGVDGLQAVVLTEAQYAALPAAEQLDPLKWFVIPRTI